jgi:raffinose/stachyose/melibiose transport system permease protein
MLAASSCHRIIPKHVNGGVAVNRKRSRQRVYIMFLAPALIVYTVFMVYPLLSSLGYSFIKWDGYIRQGFAGLDNFKKVLFERPYSERLLGALRHNVFFFVVTFLIQTTFGLFVAVALAKGGRFLRVFQTVYFAPYTLSQVVVGFLWLLLLNPTWGQVNKFLALIGLKGLARPWLGDMVTALPTIILVNAWRWLGFPITVYLAGLQGIPLELEEAARVDGATPWQAFRHVVLPLLLPTIGMMTILTFIYDFNAFELIFIMQGSSGSPYYSTDVLGTFFYRTAFGDATTGGEVGQVGLGSAIAVLMFLVICAVSIAGVWLIRRQEVEM